MNLPFNYIHKGTGAIFVNEDGESRAIIVQRYNGKLYSIGKIDKNNFDEFRTLITSMEFDNDIIAQISALFNPTKDPEENFLSQLNAIMNTQFNRTYTQPTDSKNQLVLRMKAIISAYLDKSVTENQYQGNLWDAALLYSYQYALQIDAIEPQDISRAQFARTSVAEMYNRIDLLRTDELEKSIYNVDVQINNKEIEKAWRKQELDDINPHEVEKVLFLGKQITDIENHIEQLKKQRESLVELRKTNIEKKTQYYRDIRSLTEKYRPYWNSKDLGKEIYEEELNKQGNKRDHIRAAENALVRLVLREINITHNKSDEYKESELDNLKTIRAARTEIRGMLLRQHAFDNILRNLKDHDINKPSSKKDFNDILWANRQAETLNEQYFSGDENAEARRQLPAVLYWLLVKRNSVSDLPDQDIDKIVDEYYTDLHRLNPLTEVKTIPQGYRPLSSMMSSSAFASYSDYAAQFNEYIDKHSRYEASELSKQILALSGLSIEDMLKPVQRRVRLRITQGRQTGATPMNCELVFLKLDDDRWIFFSIFPGSTFCKIISNDDMQKDKYLKYISETTNSRYRPETEDIQFNFGKNIMFDDQRWQDAVNGLTKSILYEGEEIPQIFKDGAIHQLYYNKSDNASFSGNVISALNVSVRAVLQRSARANKIEMFTPSSLQKVAFALIPYYKEIYHATNDPQYEPDVGSIVVDTIGVVLVAAQAGVQIGTIIRNISTVGKLTQQGLRAGLSGKSLQLYIIRHMAEEAAFASLKVLKTTATSLIDLVDPISLREMPSLVRTVGSKAGSLLKIIPKTTAEVSSRGINKKYIITGMTLDDMHQQTLHGAPVYSPSGAQSSDKIYYIKQDDNLYQVRWDEAYHTWRTVDQTNPGRFSYGEPIVYEYGRWQINKNYGGLRGGARNNAESQKKNNVDATNKDKGNSIKITETTDEDDVIAFGSQPVRQGLANGIPTESVWNDVLFKGDKMLAELKKKADIREAIKEPAEKCESITHTVANFMIENGFKNIRFRGMAIFANGGDEGAINHFVVVGTRRRRDYVFDISAGQFSKYYPDLNGPQILPEHVWAQKYANVSERALMKYGDYKAQEKASYYFGPYSKWLSYGPNTKIPGATVLKARSWYFPGKLLAKSTQPGFTMIDMPVPEHPIRTAYRNRRVTTGESGVCWDYAVGLVEDAKVIETGTANDLRNGLKLAAQYNNSASSTGGGLDGLFASTRVINEKSDLSRMKPGELLVFMEVDPNNVGKGARPVHCVVSLGNGRFAGTKNSILDTSLGDHKRLLNVRQLGEFNSGILTRYGNKAQPPLQLIAGTPRDMAKLNVPIRKLAEMFAQPATGKADIAKGTTNLLAMGEELSPEQAHEIYVRLKTMFATSADQQRATLKHIFSSWTKIKDQAQLGALPKGQLIVFEPKSNKGPLKHVMYSLGDKKFLMIDPQRLDKRLISKTGIIHVSMFNNDLLKAYNISTGPLDFTKISNQFLLRWGIVSVFSASVVGVGLREAMTGTDNKRPDDPEELSNDIIESILSQKKDFFSVDIKQMRVSSLFGSYGSHPPEKALAYFTKKKIVTNPWVFSSALREDWWRNELRKFYEPTDFKYPEDLEKTAEQERRNIAFWNRLKEGYQANFFRPTPPGEFEKLLRAIMDVAHWNLGITGFLERFPEYKKGLYVSENLLREIVDDKVIRDDSFAERCWDLLMMSSYSADVNNGLLTKYLSV